MLVKLYKSCTAITVLFVGEAHPHRVGMLILRKHEHHPFMLTSAEVADTWSSDQKADKHYHSSTLGQRGLKMTARGVINWKNYVSED